MVYQERLCLNPECNYCWDMPNVPSKAICPECGSESKQCCTHAFGIYAGRPHSRKINLDYRVYNESKNSST